MKKKRPIEKIGYDLETLKRWKYSSTRETFDWLQTALEFSLAAKRGLTKKP